MVESKNGLQNKHQNHASDNSHAYFSQIDERRKTNYARVGSENAEAHKEQQRIDGQGCKQRNDKPSSLGRPVMDQKCKYAGQDHYCAVHKHDAPVRESSARKIPLGYIFNRLHYFIV